jgi:hypothetical protein
LRPAEPAFFKRNPQLYVKPLCAENNTKEPKKQKKSVSIRENPWLIFFVFFVPFRGKNHPSPLCQ